jgi:hypothetical protein
MIVPHEPSILSRLVAERSERDDDGKTIMRALDAPIPRNVEASSDVASAIRKAHAALNEFHPLVVGTYLQITFAYTKTLKRVIGFECSSTRVWFKAKQRNEFLQRRYEAGHLFTKGPVEVFGLKIWPWWKVERPEFIEVPDLPNPDPWERGGEIHAKMEEIVFRNFEAPLTSLWKSFIQDGRADHEGPVATQLLAQGYRLKDLALTQVGVGDLAFRVRNYREGAGMLTDMGEPDLQELGSEFIRSISSHGSTGHGGTKH